MPCDGVHALALLEHLHDAGPMFILISYIKIYISTMITTTTTTTTTTIIIYSLLIYTTYRIYNQILVVISYMLRVIHAVLLRASLLLVLCLLLV